MKILSIQSNRIVKLEGLEELETLEELYLSHNGIEKIEGLENNVCSYEFLQAIHANISCSSSYAHLTLATISSPSWKIFHILLILKSYGYMTIHLVSIHCSRGEPSARPTQAPRHPGTQAPSGIPETRRRHAIIRCLHQPGSFR